MKQVLQFILITLDASFLLVSIATGNEASRVINIRRYGTCFTVEILLL